MSRDRSGERAAWVAIVLGFAALAAVAIFYLILHG